MLEPDLVYSLFSLFFLTLGVSLMINSWRMNKVTVVDINELPILGNSFGRLLGPQMINKKSDKFGFRFAQIRLFVTGLLMFGVGVAGLIIIWVL